VTRHGSPTRTVDAEGGSATVWVLACCLVVLAGGALAGMLGLAATARHRAAAAADLAALAAAGAVAREAAPGDACSGAARVAAAAGAAVTACTPLGQDVLVTVVVRTGLPWGGPASAVARAGPAGLPPP